MPDSDWGVQVGKDQHQTKGVPKPQRKDKAGN